jgi:CheY-like chemotaxis protein
MMRASKRSRQWPGEAGQGLSFARVAGTLIMTDKTLRILIADELDEQVVQIERTLNHLGYFRVVPVASLDELMTMVQSAFEPFDLLIANTDMAVRSGVDLPRFCKASPQVRHALLYEAQKADLPEPADPSQTNAGVSVAQLPDSEVLKKFMAIVESPQAPLENKVRVIGEQTPGRKGRGQVAGLRPL